MVKSMTGYGRGEAVLHERTITVEVRSVNNRYLDCSIKMPRLYVFAEDAIKTRVQTSISRGKVDVFVSIDSSKADSVSVSVNRPVADGYYAALTELRDAYGLRDDLSVSLLSRFQDVLLVEKAQEDVETVAADICQVLDLALADFSAMREREGQKLREDILSRAETIGRLTSFVEEQSPKTVSEYRARLEAKMRDVLQNTQIDESRILTEAAILPIRWPWMKRRCVCAAIWPSFGRCWSWTYRWAESWTSSFRNSTARPTPSAQNAMILRPPKR